VTWTRIGDDWTDRPAVLGVTRSARLLLLEMYVYGNRHTTDGEVPEAAIPRLTDAEDWRGLLADLAAAGLVEAVDGGAWQLDWSEQETAEQVKARREANQEKQRRYRDRKERHQRGDHSECDPRYCTGHVTGNTTGHATGLVTPSHPVPARPVPLQGTGTGNAGHASADAAPPRPGVNARHPFRDDGSGKSCSTCGLGAGHATHTRDEAHDKDGTR